MQLLVMLEEIDLKKMSNCPKEKTHKFICLDSGVT